MSEKNEILEEQRRAREEFLKLKRMQNGEMDAPPKPSEVSITPKTFSEKLSNFWFHYKWHTIAIIASLIVISIAVSQCVSRINYDFEIVYFTNTYTLDDNTEKIADYIEEYATDVNGDGEVNVQVINCSISSNSKDYQLRNTNLTKLQSIIAGNEKVILYITDKDSIHFFDNIGENIGGLFEGEPLEFGSHFYDSIEIVGVEPLPEELQISLRKVSKTVFDESEEAQKAFKEAEKLLAKLKTVQ